MVEVVEAHSMQQRQELMVDLEEVDLETLQLPMRVELE
jgi:hypothetical protein